MGGRVIDGLFVRTAGPLDANVLILLHGFADSGLAFTPLLETTLADRFHLVAVDLAGFGSSPPQAGIGSIADHARSIAALAGHWPGRVGLVAHSVASMIAVEAAAFLGERLMGLFSIEGNLTVEDAYFSGRAADFDEPEAFKRCFLDDIWTMAQTNLVMRRYHASAVFADPVAMWELGRDARRMSVGDSPGRAYQRIHPSQYYWSRASTVATTARWIEQAGLDQRQFSDAGHWPMIDQPERTAGAIASFFQNL
jgi:pimeloyl-ACP methyl ester carboxylesterase